jgi:hypothetical protein
MVPNGFVSQDDVGPKPGVYLENTIAQLVLDYIEMVVGLAVLSSSPKQKITLR